jgi:hypothetical protein
MWGDLMGVTLQLKVKSRKRMLVFNTIPRFDCKKLRLNLQQRPDELPAEVGSRFDCKNEPIYLPATDLLRP